MLGVFAELARGIIRAANANKEWHDQLHAMDYLVYAYLQLAGRRGGASNDR